MPPKNGNGKHPHDDDPHVHVHAIHGDASGGIGQAIEQAINSAMGLGMNNPLREAYEKGAVLARNTILGVLLTEYQGLAERARVSDAMLSDPHAVPTLDEASAAWARHNLASLLAKRIGKQLADPDQRAEYTALYRDHQAAQERWLVRVANATPGVKEMREAEAAQRSKEG